MKKTARIVFYVAVVMPVLALWCAGHGIVALGEWLLAKLPDWDPFE